MMSGTENDALKEFKETFLEVTQLLGFISHDKIFRQEHGFSMTDYVDERRSCASKLREIADSIERVVRDTGIARTVGGTVGVISGAAAIGGLILAPFTAGISLVLTVGGVAGGIAAAANNVAAAIVKDVKVNAQAKEVKKVMDSLETKDVVVQDILQQLKVKVTKLRNLYGDKSVIDFVKDGVEITRWIKKIGYNIAYKGYTVYESLEAIRFATRIAEFIQADIEVMEGIAVGMAAPGLSIFGRTLILAGSTVARVVSGVLAVVGIAFGIWDIAAGAMDIVGSKHAKAYRKAADELDQHTEEYVELLEKTKNKK